MRPLRLEELGGGKPRKGKRGAGDDDAERLLEWQLAAHGLPAHVGQHRFAFELGRQWRWDFAWIDLKVALEVQGGIWVEGAHAHPTKILLQMEKHNDAALLGWRWFQFTPDQIRTGAAVAFLQRFFFHHANPEAPVCAPTLPPARRSSGTARLSTRARAGAPSSRKRTARS